MDISPVDPIKIIEKFPSYVKDENKYDIVFNIYLVLTNRRHAFLFETFNLNVDFDVDIFLKDIVEIFPELLLTTESLLESKISRVFIHKYDSLKS